MFFKRNVYLIEQNIKTKFLLADLKSEKVFTATTLEFYIVFSTCLKVSKLD